MLTCAHLADFTGAFNFARRLKILVDLTLYEYICKFCTSEPDRFIRDPIQQMPGLNTWFYFRIVPFLGANREYASVLRSDGTTCVSGVSARSS